MPKIPFELTPSDRKYLEALLKKGQMGVKQFKRATALLELAHGKTIATILPSFPGSTCCRMPDS
jgi:hypothetical protein